MLRTAFGGTGADLQLPHAQLHQEAGTQGCRRGWGGPGHSPPGQCRGSDPLLVPQVGTCSMELMGNQGTRQQEKVLKDLNPRKWSYGVWEKTGQGNVPSHSCHHPVLHGQREARGPSYTQASPGTPWVVSCALCARNCYKIPEQCPLQRFSFLLGERQQLAWLGELGAWFANPARTRWREARSEQVGNREIKTQQPFKGIV